MPKPDQTNEDEPIQEAREDDSREEDIVSDSDADTRDIEDTARADFAALGERIDRIDGMLERIFGGITAIRDAQSVMVSSGAVIRETEKDVEEDDFVPLEELDFSI